MFGSRREHELLDGRRVIWRTSSWGVPLKQAIIELEQIVKDYPENENDMLIGYWEYGDEIVVTIPSDSPATP